MDPEEKLVYKLSWLCEQRDTGNFYHNVNLLMNTFVANDVLINMDEIRNTSPDAEDTRWLGSARSSLAR